MQTHNIWNQLLGNCCGPYCWRKIEYRQDYNSRVRNVTVIKTPCILKKTSIIFATRQEYWGFINHFYLSLIRGFWVTPFPLPHLLKQNLSSHVLKSPLLTFEGEIKGELHLFNIFPRPANFYRDCLLNTSHVDEGFNSLNWKQKKVIGCS